MRKFTVPLLVALDAGCSAPDAGQPAAPAAAASDAAPSPVGLWVVPRSQVEAANDRAEAEGREVAYSRPDPFYFDGELATMHLIRMKVWESHSPDDFYRVRTSWHGPDLYWLPPFGQRAKLATFRRGRFEVEQSGLVWSYDRAEGTAVTDELVAYLRPRPPHDYSMPRMDPEWAKLVPK